MKYKVVTVGGTFDILHIGHLALLDKAFEVGEDVIIGVTSDVLVEKMGKSIINDYTARVENLSKILSQRYSSNRFKIVMLDDEFGPAMNDPRIEAIIVSKETEHKCKMLNDIRKAKGMGSLHVITIDLILAKDGKRISSTRIRAGEIDAEGNILKNNNNNR